MSKFGTAHLGSAWLSYKLWKGLVWLMKFKIALQSQVILDFFIFFYIPGIILTLHFFLKLFNSRCGVEEYLLIPPKSWVVCNSEQILEMFLFQKFSAILIPYGSSNSSTTSKVCTYSSRNAFSLYYFGTNVKIVHSRLFKKFSNNTQILLFGYIFLKNAPMRIGVHTQIHDIDCTKQYHQFLDFAIYNRCLFQLIGKANTR